MISLYKFSLHFSWYQLGEAGHRYMCVVLVNGNCENWRETTITFVVESSRQTELFLIARPRIENSTRTLRLDILQRACYFSDVKMTGKYVLCNSDN